MTYKYVFNFRCIVALDLEVVSTDAPPLWVKATGLGEDAAFLWENARDLDLCKDADSSAETSTSALLLGLTNDCDSIHFSISSNRPQQSTSPSVIASHEYRAREFSFAGRPPAVRTAQMSLIPGLSLPFSEANASRTQCCKSWG